MMPKLQTLIDEILIVTMQIQLRFPELYQVLGETPLFLAYVDTKINNADFERYLESLQHQMIAFENASNKPLTIKIQNMSKDKGSKNHKKAPADRSNGKVKIESSYKSEGKLKDPAIAAFVPNPEFKQFGKDKKK